LAILAPSLCVAKTAKFNYVLDPEMPEAAMAAWLFYLGARDTYCQGHKLPNPPVGEVVPSFKGEVSSRLAATAMYQVMASGRKDLYWETMIKVAAQVSWRSTYGHFCTAKNGPGRRSLRNWWHSKNGGDPHYAIILHKREPF
jgi:hypothetical protein